MSNMLLIKSDWNNQETFKMIPIDLSCPFVECIYDRDSKVLAIIGKTTKQSFHMVRKIDDNGDIVTRKIRTEGSSPYKEERKLLETFQEYYITNVDDIRQIVKMFGSNNSTFDFEKYLVGMDATGTPSTPAS